MTAVTDMKQAIELIVGHTITAATLTRIGAAGYRQDPHSVVATGLVAVVDPGNPTNEERAEVMRANIKIHWQGILGQDSDINSDDAAEATKTANRIAAVADMT